MMLFVRLAPPKARKTRSKAGCNYCREKKKKCDEQKPQCTLCLSRGRECIYRETIMISHRKSSHWCSHSTSGKNANRESLPSPSSWDPIVKLEDTDMEDWTAQNGLLSSTQNNKRQLHDVDPDVVEWPGYMSLIIPKDDVLYTETFHDPIEEGNDELEPAASAQISTNDSSTNGEEVSSNDIGLNQSFLTPPGPLSYLNDSSFSQVSSQKLERDLVDHFCNSLSHRLVFHEGNGNAFQKLVLPLSYESPAVLHSICALASAHLEIHGKLKPGRSEYFYNQAVGSLRKQIQLGTLCKSKELLATIVLLIYLEALTRSKATNFVDVHMQGALAIVESENSIFIGEDPTALFLQRALYFHDAITSLSSRKRPLLSSLYHNSLRTTQFGTTILTGISDGADALLGMTMTLWPILYRICGLFDCKRQFCSAVIHGDLHQAAAAFETIEEASLCIHNELEQWKPMPVMSTPASKGICHNALAYRFSASIYLYRLIQGFPRDHVKVQEYTHKSLRHCARTGRMGSPMSALLWPLFIAACEAESSGDKELARQTFEYLYKRQGMANICHAWDVVQEVWSRASVEKRETMERSLEDGTSDPKSQESLGRDNWWSVCEDMKISLTLS